MEVGLKNKNYRVTSLRWWHRLFLTLLPLTKRTNNYSRKRHHWENPRTQKWGWSTFLHHRDLDRRVISSYTLTTLPLTQASIAPHGQVSPEPLVSPMVKENLGGGRAGETASPSSVSHIAGAPTLWSHTMGTAGAYVLFNHCESDCDGERGRGLQQPVHSSWQTEFIHAVPSSNHSLQLCSSAEPSQEFTLIRELSEV